MEKRYDCLFDLIFAGLGHQMLVREIRSAVRRAARTVPTFRDSKNGCIRITIVPLSPLADMWLGGGLSEYSEDPEGLGEVEDICEREYIFKIHPTGSHTIQWKDPKDGHVEPVNCYGYSALKTAWAAKVRQWQNVNRPIEPCPASGYYVEENGWSMHEGAVCAEVKYKDEDFIRLYVCTSGAKSEEDLNCSLVGMIAAQKFFERASEVFSARAARSRFFTMSPDFVSMQET